MAGIWMDIVNSVLNTADTVLPYILEPGREQRQQSRTKELMDLQVKNQKELNTQGQGLQLSTWEATNYPGQIAMIKKAGLNPALLYGKGGGGGATTGSQSGGSAAMGSSGYAPYMPMDLSNALMTTAQMKLMNAEARKTEAEAKAIETTAIPEAETRIAKMIAETTDINTKQALTAIQADIARIDQANRQYVIDAEISNINASTTKLLAEGKLTQDNAVNIIKETAERAIGQTLTNELTASKTKLTDTERQGIITSISQKWTELGIEGANTNIKDKERQIHEFEANLKAEFPSFGTVTGNVLSKAFKSLENLTKGVISSEPQKVEYK